ncbi:hypothetical protein ACWDTP_17585 [Mycobacterium sp. NPDC003449]
MVKPAGDQGPRGMPVLVLGYGPVARSYIDLVRGHRDEFRQRFGVDVHIAGIRASDQQIVLGDPDGAVVPARDEWAPRTALTELLAGIQPRVVVQAVPSDPGGADAALADALTALTHGAHLVTATKSPLLSGWSELARAARSAARAVRISGATGAALPAGDLARSGLLGFDIGEIRGCLNGTATYVLDRLGGGENLPEAIASARRRGIAEADPAADLSGHDAAVKIRLLAALLWGWDPADCTVHTEAVDDATVSRAAGAATRGAVLRQVGSARLDRPGRAEVELREFHRSELPFGALTGPEKAVTFVSPDSGDITVSGGRSSPTGAARSMLKDTLSLAGDGPVGFA